MSAVSPSLAPDVDVDLDLVQSRLYNKDLAPVPASRRKWRVGSFAALWISMSACIPTYMLASSLIGGGMNWSQAILTIFLGNVIVVIPMILNAHAGTHYGIPFPVFCRASFGTRGANIPALMRAFVACGWFGIQTWIGGNAIYKILAVFVPSLAGGIVLPILDITIAQFVCFLFFWGINMLVVYKGIDCIRWLLNIKAPLLIALGLLLLWWAYQNAGGFGPILSQPSAFDPGQPKSWTILFVLRSRAHRHGRFLGDAVTQHSGFFALRALTTRSSRRPGTWFAIHDGALRFYRRGRDVGDDDHLRSADLGSGRCADAFHKSDRACDRDAGALHRNTGDKHRRECR